MIARGSNKYPRSILLHAAYIVSFAIKDYKTTMLTLWQIPATMFLPFTLVLQIKTYNVEWLNFTKTYFHHYILLYSCF